MKRTTRKMHPRSLLGSAVLTGILLIPGFAAAGERGRCISADVPAPMVLPDGSIHGAGHLRICFARSYSPVAGLHRTYVNGKSVGLYTSQKGEAEEATDSMPFFVFRRNGLGNYVLEGYAAPDGSRTWTYRLPGHEVNSWQLGESVRAARNSEGPQDGADKDIVILLAPAT